MKKGCDKCNLCKCNKGKRDCPINKKGCLNINVLSDLKKIFANGCYRLNPAKDKCIFYSPCIDDDKSHTCDTHPKGYCQQCCKCKCLRDGTPQCDVKIISCEMQFELSAASSGCWALVKDACR